MNTYKIEERYGLRAIIEAAYECEFLELLIDEAEEEERIHLVQERDELLQEFSHRVVNGKIYK